MRKDILHSEYLHDSTLQHGLFQVKEKSTGLGADCDSWTITQKLKVVKDLRHINRQVYSESCARPASGGFRFKMVKDFQRLNLRDILTSLMCEQWQKQDWNLLLTCGMGRTRSGAAAANIAVVNHTIRLLRELCEKYIHPDYTEPKCSADPYGLGARSMLDAILTVRRDYNRENGWSPSLLERRVLHLSPEEPYMLDRTRLGQHFGLERRGEKLKPNQACPLHLDRNNKYVRD